MAIRKTRVPKFKTAELPSGSIPRKKRVTPKAYLGKMPKNKKMKQVKPPRGYNTPSFVIKENEQVDEGIGDVIKGAAKFAKKVAGKDRPFTYINHPRNPKKVKKYYLKDEEMYPVDDYKSPTKTKVEVYPTGRGSHPTWGDDVEQAMRNNMKLGIDPNKRQDLLKTWVNTRDTGPEAMKRQEIAKKYPINLDTGKVHPVSMDESIEMTNRWMLNEAGIKSRIAKGLIKMGKYLGGAENDTVKMGRIAGDAAKTTTSAAKVDNRPFTYVLDPKNPKNVIKYHPTKDELTKPVAPIKIGKYPNSGDALSRMHDSKPNIYRTGFGTHPTHADDLAHAKAVKDFKYSVAKTPERKEYIKNRPLYKDWVNHPEAWKHGDDIAAREKTIRKNPINLETGKPLDYPKYDPFKMRMQKMSRLAPEQPTKTNMRPSPANNSIGGALKNSKWAHRASSAMTGAGMAAGGALAYDALKKSSKNYSNPDPNKRSVLKPPMDNSKISEGIFSKIARAAKTYDRVIDKGVGLTKDVSRGMEKPLLRATRSADITKSDRLPSLTIGKNQRKTFDKPPLTTRLKKSKIAHGLSGAMTGAGMATGGALTYDAIKDGKYAAPESSKPPKVFTPDTENFGYKESLEESMSMSDIKNAILNMLMQLGTPKFGKELYRALKEEEPEMFQELIDMYGALLKHGAVTPRQQMKMLQQDDRAIDLAHRLQDWVGDRIPPEGHEWFAKAANKYADIIGEHKLTSVRGAAKKKDRDEEIVEFAIGDQHLSASVRKHGSEYIMEFFDSEDADMFEYAAHNQVHNLSESALNILEYGVARLDATRFVISQDV